MVLSNFKALPLKDMIIHTWQQGEYLTARKSDDFIILLYQVHSFYVEMYYNYTHREIEWARPFSSTEELETYLQSIDLSELFSKQD